MWKPVSSKTAGLAALWCGLTVLFSAADAYGQSKQAPRRQYSQSFRNRPTVSPYTSLINNGDGGAVLNYYNIIRPRQQAAKTARSFTNQLKQVESNLQSLQRRPAAAGADILTEPVTTGRMEPTGHPTSFGYVGKYYAQSQ